MADPPKDRLLAVFREHGVKGEIREVTPRAADEAVFVVGGEDARAVHDAAPGGALQELLARKVWVVPDMPIWRRQSQPL